jgi:hypothetical protein
MEQMASGFKIYHFLVLNHFGQVYKPAKKRLGKMKALEWFASSFS